MGLIIKSKGGKLILPVCTKAGNSPYNKGGYLARVESERIVDQYNYKGGKLVILRPVIDKLIFEYNFGDCGSHKRHIQATTLKNADALVSQYPACKLATKHNVGGDRLYHLQKSHSGNYVLTYKATGAKIIIQLDALKKGAAFLRCDLNPARLGAGGMVFFRDFLSKLLTNDYKAITFETVAKRDKAIKRIDIAVDMLGVDASDLEGRYVYKDKQLKKMPVQNPTGRLETMYFQMPENDKNQAYWYNKKQWFKDNRGKLLAYAIAILVLGSLFVVGSTPNVPATIAQPVPSLAPEQIVQQKKTQQDAQSEREKRYRVQDAAKALNSIKTSELLLNGAEIDLKNGKIGSNMDVYAIGVMLGLMDSTVQTLQEGWTNRAALSPPDIKHLQSLEAKLSSFQQRTLPKMRLAFKKRTAETLWEHDVTVSVGGAGNTVISFYGFWFAANANIKAAEAPIDELMTRLRFKNALFAPYEHARGSIYTLEAPGDGVIAGYANGFQKLDKKRAWSCC